MLRLPNYSSVAQNSYGILFHVGVRRVTAALLAASTAVLGVAVAHAAPPTDAVARAGKFLVDRQGADGGWADAPVEQVAEGATGLVSASITDAPLTKALNFIAAKGPADANRAPETSRVILAVVAAGKNPRDFGKVDYVGRLRTYYNPNTGSYDPATDANSLSILALVAAKDPVPQRAITSLQGRQCNDGGFPRAACLFGSDVTSSSFVLEAFVAAGVGSSDPVYAKARSYLVSAQNKDGGFGPGVGQPTAALPTGAALAAIAALAEDPTASPWRLSPTADPISALLALQDASGGFRPDAATAAPDAITTARALLGLSGHALPLRPATAVASTTTTAPGAVPSTVTTQATRRTAVPGRRTTRTSAPIAGSTSSTNPDVKLAAPAGRDSVGGRSLLGLLPFVATLFGAGAVGLVLRRRART
jgi:hypothetical protein